VITGEPCAVNAARTVRGGRRKRTRATGTSPAAYLTLNVHLAQQLAGFAADLDALVRIVKRKLKRSSTGHI
jgi:hypothetical protein